MKLHVALMVLMALVVGVMIGQVELPRASAQAAGITDPQAVKFSNEQLRVAMDAISTAYWTCKRVETNYYADPSLGAAYMAGIGEVIADGSATDGRTAITGNDALGGVTRCSELVADMEANNNAKLNTVLRLSVNGGPRF